MLSKVTDQVKRRSIQLKLPKQQRKHQLRVDIPPELVRWSNFSTPFPSVSLGGYTRFYTTHTTPESTESLTFCPLLSQSPETSSSSEIPSKSPLFANLKRRCLPLIREVSLESLTLNKPRHLTITTGPKPPYSLKRRRRRLLRTPSIERDFIQGRYRSLWDTSTTISELSGGTSSTDIVLSPHSTSSTESRLSHEPCDSNPITPSTSIGSENDEEIFSTLFDKLSPTHHPNKFESMMTRPISSISFCTAATAFSEI